MQKSLCIAAMLLFAATAYAQRSSELSVDLPDSRTMAVQDKVDKLFDAGEYERAYFIYRNELAPVGDKYAQYMVGFMHQMGLGVEAEDAVAAAAWYQLAAERGTREFVVVRDRILHVLDEADADAARQLYRELRLQYSDLAVLLASIKRNAEQLQNRTGTRVNSQSSPVTVIETGRSRFSSGDYYGEVREELEARIQLLKEIGDFQDVVADADRLNLRDLERRVQQQIEALPE